MIPHLCNELYRIGGNRLRSGESKSPDKRISLSGLSYSVFLFHYIDQQLVLGAQCRDAHLRCDLLCDLTQGICHSRIRMRYQNGLSTITADAHVLVNRNLAEEVGLTRLRQLLTAAGAEDVHT